MDTRDKLEEARYFLDSLRGEENPNRFNYTLSAFLGAWRSVMDIMLYDVAELWRLGLTRENRITDNEFSVAAKALNHSNATRFIRWWRQKRGLLKQNALWKKRTLIIHRGYPPNMRQFRVYITESLALSSTFSISTNTELPETSESSNRDAVPTGGSPSQSTPETAIPPASAPQPTGTQSTVEVRFQDFPSVSVVDLCSQALELMDEIVEEAESTFNIHL